MKSNLFNRLLAVFHTKTRNDVSKDRRDCGDNPAISLDSHGTVRSRRSPDGIALATAFTVSGASAHDSYGHSHYSNSVTTPSYTNTYTVPTIDLGPIEQVQPNSSVQYVQPATTTTYSAPTTGYNSSAVTYAAPSYTTPSYTTPSYAAQPTYTYTAPSYGSATYGSTYTAPSYTAPTYAAPSYTTPSFTVPTYTTPAYVATVFDATPRVRARMDRLRNRIVRADNRGDLRDGELRKLRKKMRKIRRTIRAHKSDDGVIDRKEFAELQKKMSRQSDRIRRLANNDRVVGQLVSPYTHHYPRF